MRRILAACLAAALAAAALLPIPACADDYPTRPIRLMVGFRPGGPTDVTFRKLADLASKRLGQPIVVENKAGAAATLAPSTMAKSDPPDGYTIAVANATLLRYPYMQKVDWDPLRDFTWIAGLGGFTFVLAVKADSPFKTFEDLAAHARANPGRISVATAGAGSSMHLLSEAIAHSVGFKITHVGYRSSSEATMSLVADQTVAALDAAGAILPFVEDGKLRILVSFDAEPADWLPGVPTARSLGHDLVYPSPYGLVGPKCMPPAIVAKIWDAFQAAAESDEYAALMTLLRQPHWLKGPAEYAAWARDFHVSERALVERAQLLRQP